MKLSSRKQIQALAQLKGDKNLTVSFYLDTDKSRLSQKEINVSFKNLLAEGRARLASVDSGKNSKDALDEDLNKISLFGSRILPSYTAAGLAVFSSSASGLWQDLSLPRAPRNHIIIDRAPYLRPLSVILDEYHHICALLLNRHGARWYDIDLGEIALLESLTSDVPNRVREGGWQGYESKRIERHIDAHLHDHFKKVAQKTFDLFKTHPFDWLFLELKEEYRSSFEPLLHPYLKDRLKGWLKTNPNDSEDKILKQAMEMEKKLRLEEEAGLAQTLVSGLESGVRAVSGVREVLRTLNAAEVQTLVVTRNFSLEGRVCPKCQFLYLDELQCPICLVKTEKVQDIVHEAVHSAMNNKGRVRYVTSPSKLDHYGKVGAFLRYKK
jgi:peptide chain release factor subunit 1